MTDAYRCPACGTENYPEDDAFYPPVPRHVFTNCNVCGIPLRTIEEESMGMCGSCAAE